MLGRTYTKMASSSNGLSTSFGNSRNLRRKSSLPDAPHEDLPASQEGHLYILAVYIPLAARGHPISPYILYARATPFMFRITDPEILRECANSYYVEHVNIVFEKLDGAAKEYALTALHKIAGLKPGTGNVRERLLASTGEERVRYTVAVIKHVYEITNIKHATKRAVMYGTTLTDTTTEEYRKDAVKMLRDSSLAPKHFSAAAINLMNWLRFFRGLESRWAPILHEYLHVCTLFDANSEVVLATDSGDPLPDLPTPPLIRVLVRVSAIVGARQTAIRECFEDVILKRSVTATSR